MNHFRFFKQVHVLFLSSFVCVVSVAGIAQEAPVSTQPAETKAPTSLPKENTDPSLMSQTKSVSPQTQFNVGADLRIKSSTFYQERYLSTSEPLVETHAFFAYDLVDTCHAKDSCLRFLVLGGLGGGGYTRSGLGFVRFSPGVGIKVFFASQRMVSLSILSGLGYKHTFLPEDSDPFWVQIPQYQRNVDQKDLLMFWFQPGVEFHLGAMIGTAGSQGFSLAASFKIENGPAARGEGFLSGSVDVSFLAGLRYQF